MGKKKVEINKVIDPRKRQNERQKAAGPPAIFRKIEVDPSKAAEAKKKIEEQEKKSKEDREQEALERKAMERKKKKTQVLVKKEGIVEIPDTISIKEFSEKVGVPAGEIISVLLKNGVMVTLTQSLDFDTFAIVAPEIRYRN